MPLDSDTIRIVRNYVDAHLAEESWYERYFDFISDVPLRIRLTEEFQAARFLYKLLESISAEGWLYTAQVKGQILQYASIYEATIHHLLFERCQLHLEVAALQEIERPIKISVSPELDRLEHNGKKILTMYRGTARREITSIRFDAKVHAAVRIGLFSRDLGDDLIAIYETRNAIHLHAELRKQVKYEISMSTVAYRRMQPFREQVTVAMQTLGI